MGRPSKRNEERQKRVLDAVVRTYVRRARPVSSAQVAEEFGRGVSTATIRNEMSALEEAGLLAKPHTSAGRVPTGAGYRCFVRGMEESPLLPAGQREYILKCLVTGRKKDNVLQEGIKLLTELSRLIGVVLLPGFDNSHLAHVEFIPLGEKRVMVLLVLEGEQVRRKVLRQRHRLNREELHRLSLFVMGQLAGLTLEAARTRLESMLKNRADLPLRLVSARFLCGGLEAMLGELSAGTVSDAPFVYSHGWSDVDQPEFRNADFMRRVFRVVNDGAALGKMAGRRISGPGVSVVIGDESLLPEMKDCSLVSAACAGEENETALLAVIGPLRMDYEHIIPLVDFTSHVIDGKANMAED